MSASRRIKVEQAECEDLDFVNSVKKGKQGKKAKDEQLESKDSKPDLKQEKITDHMQVEKKKRKIDRFNGMPEEEVVLRTLPDHLAPDLDIVIVGINPGLMAAYIGHHYAGPGNHFWKCLYLSGLVPEPKNCYDDYKLIDFGIGFTNICARTTRGSADLKRNEIKEGAAILKEKLKEYRPKIAAFNGKGIYEIFSGNKNIVFGRQPELIEGTSTVAFVMPSSSARCAQLPRAIDKVPFYDALRKLRDHLVGRIPHLDDSEVTFPKLELKCVKKEERIEDGEGADEDSIGGDGVWGDGSSASATPIPPNPIIKSGADEVRNGRKRSRTKNGSRGRETENVTQDSSLPASESSNQPTSSPEQNSASSTRQNSVDDTQQDQTSRDNSNYPQNSTAAMPQAQLSFNVQQQELSIQQQQHLSLQQQQQHLQRQLWVQQQDSLVGLPQAVPVNASLDHMNGFTFPFGSTQISDSQSAMFGMMAQAYPQFPSFGSGHSFDALGFPVGTLSQVGQQGKVNKSSGSTNSTGRVPKVKTEPVDA